MLSWARSYLPKSRAYKGRCLLPNKLMMDDYEGKIMMLVVEVKYYIWHYWEITQVLWVSDFITTRYLDKSTLT